MIEIRIGGELAAEHPRVVVDSLERGDRIEVFESSAAARETTVGEVEASNGGERREAAQGVNEVLIVDPRDRTVQWLGVSGGEYRPLAPSGLLGSDQPSSPAGSTGPRAPAGTTRRGPPPHPGAAPARSAATGMRPGW